MQNNNNNNNNTSNFARLDYLISLLLRLEYIFNVLILLFFLIHRTSYSLSDIKCRDIHNTLETFPALHVTLSLPPPLLIMWYGQRVNKQDRMRNRSRCNGKSRTASKTNVGLRPVICSHVKSSIFDIVRTVAFSSFSISFCIAHKSRSIAVIHGTSCHFYWMGNHPMSSTIAQICSRFAISFIIRTVYEHPSLPDTFCKLEIFTIIRTLSRSTSLLLLVAIKSGYCQTTRIDLFLSRCSFDEENQRSFNHCCQVSRRSFRLNPFDAQHDVPSFSSFLYV